MSAEKKRNMLKFETQLKIIDFLRAEKSRLNGKKIEQIVVEIEQNVGVLLSNHADHRQPKKICELAGVEWDKSRSKVKASALDRTRLRVLFEAVEGLYKQLGVPASNAFTKTLEALGTSGSDDEDDDDLSDDDE